MKPGAWWRNEFNSLVDAGILTGGVRKQLEAHYALEDSASRCSRGSLTFILSSLIAGEILTLGGFLLLGGVWNFFPPGWRVFFGCLPAALLSVYGLVLSLRTVFRWQYDCWGVMMLPAIMLALWSVWSVFPGCCDWCDLLLASAVLALPALVYFQTVFAFVAPVVIVILLFFFSPSIFSIWYAWWVLFAALVWRIIREKYGWRRQVCAALVWTVFSGAVVRICLLDETAALPLLLLPAAAFSLVIGNVADGGKRSSVFSFMGELTLVSLTAAGSFFAVWDFEGQFRLLSVSGVLLSTLVIAVLVSSAIIWRRRHNWRQLLWPVAALALIAAGLCGVPARGTAFLSLLVFVVDSLRRLLGGRLRNRPAQVIIGSVELASFAAIRFFWLDGLSPVATGVAFLLAAVLLSGTVFGICRWRRNE